MSVKWIRAVKDLDTVRGADFAVLRSLAWRANDEGVAIITTDALAVESHVSRPTLFRALNRLERAGLIERDRTGKPTTYRLRQSQNETIQSQNETVSQSQNETILTVSQSHPDTSESQDETIMVSRVRHIETETSTNILPSVVVTPVAGELESLQSGRNKVLPDAIKNFISDITPGLTADVAREWEDVWKLAHDEEHIESPGLTLRHYLSDCRRRELTPTPDGWVKWHRRAEGWARERMEQARQAARASIDTSPEWLGKYEG